MNKGKNISIPTSVEAQVRTRARNLPIHKCYINKDWEEVQLASILVSRKHTNGNITMGNFLVDLKLLGVKDCVYSFNESSLRMNEILEGRGKLMGECDYNLVHNVIYAGLEFAEDYGFAPHKNFKIAQYLLEEDTDDIPLMEVPLGDDGVPVLVVPHGQNGQREMAILDKTAGDNYQVVFLDKNGEPEPDERSYMDILNEVMEIGIEKYMTNSTSGSFREMQVITDLIYLEKVYTYEEKGQIDAAYEHIVDDPRLSMKGDEPESTYDEELTLSLQYFEDGDTDKASAECLKVIEKNPHDPGLWHVYIYNLSIDSDLVDEKAVKEAYSRFPGDPVIKAWYAEWLAQEERADEVFTLFDNIPGLDALTTDNTSTNPYAFISFCFAYAMAWLLKSDILHAEPYYQVIVRLGLDYRLSEDIQYKMTDLKRNKLDELLDAGVFDDNV